MASILIVEDNELSRDLVVRRLVKRGHCVREAATGEECCKLLSSLDFDLIVLDLGLPDWDGWELARHLKQDSRTAAIPILAWTAHARAEDRTRALACGCDEFETKPLALNTFMAKVQSLLKAESVVA